MLKFKNFSKIVVALTVLSFLSIGCTNSQKDQDTIGLTAKCEELFNQKKSRLFDNLGQVRVIYNPKLDTCLALNIYNNPNTMQYHSIVIDLLTDKTIYYYSTKKGENVDKNSGKTLDDMFKDIRDYGFVVYGGGDTY